MCQSQFLIICGSSPFSSKEISPDKYNSNNKGTGRQNEQPGSQ